jgi:hypothetical protein
VLRNCPTCGRLLTSAPGTPCPFCRAEDDAVVETIAAHLAAGGDRSLSAVVAGTGIPAKVVRRLVESGRITLAVEGGAPTNCALCGAPLRGAPGRVCTACAAKMQAAHRTAVRSVRGEAPREGPERHGYYSRPGGGRL